jgi:hypothetical protein
MRFRQNYLKGQFHGIFSFRFFFMNKLSTRSIPLIVTYIVDLYGIDTGGKFAAVVSDGGIRFTVSVRDTNGHNDKQL